MFEVQEFETKPVPAFAVQWDGTPGMANDIAHWVQSCFEAEPDQRDRVEYRRQFVGDKVTDGRLVPYLFFDFTRPRLNGRAMYKDQWLVMYDVNEPRFDIFDAQYFDETYRKPVGQE